MHPRFFFIDLFAGIGGFHLAMHPYGGACTFASEWDSYASAVYESNFGLKPEGDITKIAESAVPKHDVLCAGFPCQAFSIAGNRRGFEDARGTLFFDIARIARYHQPKVLLLENVKNLLHHDGGNTFSLMQEILHDIGYRVFTKVLNASDFGLPQNRQRLYIVGFHKSMGVKQFSFPQPSYKPVSVAEVLERLPAIKAIERGDIVFTKSPHNLLSEATTLFGEKSRYLNRVRQIGYLNKGGQGERIYDIAGYGVTLSAYGGGVGAKTGLFLTKEGVRRLTPREAARLQGFPERFRLDKNNNQAYKQLGNSVPVPVLVAIMQQVLEVVEEYL